MDITEVFALADKAGMWWPMGSSADAVHSRARIAEFARHVEAAERERCAKLAEDHECGGADDFVCRGQNCGACIAGLIRKA